MTYKTTTLVVEDNTRYPRIITSGQDTTNRKDTAMHMEPTENSHCPRYVAYAGVDDMVEASDDLRELIGILKELASCPDCEEDVAIWRDDSYLVAVVLADGTVHRFDQRPANNGRERILKLRRSK
jgi:hypothetical protein